MKNTTNEEASTIQTAERLDINALIKIIHRLDDKIAENLRKIDENQICIQTLESKNEDLRRQLAEQ